MYLKSLSLMSLAFTFTASLANSQDCLSTLKRNGLYYSENGSVTDAVRIELPLSNGVDQSKSLSLTGTIPRRYDANGMFFLRSGSPKPWFNLWSNRDDMAVLVRRQTRSLETLDADFVSVFRSDLGTVVCPAEGRQAGLGQSRNFIPQGSYIDYHQQPSGTQKQGVLRDLFHFSYENGYLNCSRTDILLDPETERQLPNPRLAYNGGDFEVQTTAGVVVEQSASVVASIILPKPAYADAVQEQRVDREDASVNVSSIEASLFHVDAQEDACLQWPAPIPTTRAGGFWAELFQLTARHESASLRLAERGDWQPIVTVLDVFKVSDNQSAGHIRLYWPQ